ncbi:hypothetical protein [Aeropyrum camini]|uniref:Uncharacterized protein n=1 Tax=Aeropyrum camini SY1 = JCM 12091 TaxID=1198449 RepID=U3TBC2_9CREN|nr:hypothetical protein [Aeropyrum camini]BAN90842.1 hypothetical protein ACAM_1373 [Aeropyrum camini SY1 = JCM 12091]
MSEDVEREEEVVAEEEPGSLELVTEEAAAEEAVEEEAEDEVAYIFDITKPELIDVMLKVADTLEAVAKGDTTVSEALAYLSTEGIEEVLAQTRKPVKKRSKTKAKKKEKKAAAKKTKAKTKKSSSGKSKSKSKSKKASSK